MEKELNQQGSVKFGYYMAIITTLLTIVTFGIAVNTPPFSGPFCKGPCFQYPYLDIAGRFPRDYYWMYPAIVLPFSYLLHCYRFLMGLLPSRKRSGGPSLPDLSWQSFHWFSFQWFMASEGNTVLK